MDYEEIIKFFNENEGFISVVISSISIALSMWAFFFSINLGKRQNQIALLEKRITVYEEIIKIYNVCKNYPQQAMKASYIGKLSIACAFLHSVDSKEYLVCTKLREIQKKEQTELNKSEKEKLRKKWLKYTDGLVNYTIRKMEDMERLQTEVHLLFTNEIEAVASSLISVYESFFRDFWALDEKQLTEIIERMIIEIENAEKQLFIEKLEKQTLTKKLFF